MNKSIDTRRIWIFLGLAFGISWAFALAIYLTGGLANSPDIIPGISLALALTALGYMFGPAAAHVLTRWLTREGWENTWLKLRFQEGQRSWLAAWLLPVVTTFFGALIYFLIFPQHFDASLGLISQLLTQAEAQANQSLPLEPQVFLLIQIGQGILLAPLINGFFTFGEEFGWRAYLQPKLMPLGFRRAMLWMGLIWGMWHAPLIAMGHNYGFGYPGAPWAGVLAMTWLTLTSGVVFGWLTLTGKSVWPAVIMHASLNGLAGVGALVLAADANPNPLLGPLPTGIIGNLPWALLAAWMLWRGGPDGQRSDVSRETMSSGPNPVPSGSLIYAQGLSKSFDDVQAVDGLDLDIQSGEVFGLLGPNGAGKTTTIRMLSALIGPSSGEANIAGYRLGEEDEQIRKSVGILTESPGLYEGLSAERNLSFFAKLYEVEDIPGQVERYLRMLGLWSRRSEAVGTFSKGMRQKLAIARALLHEPKVLYLDEPTSGLDPEAARVVREFIGTLKGEGRTIILTTHNLDEADRLCDRIAVLSTRLIAVDTPANLRRNLYGRSVVFHLAALQPAFLDAVRQKDYVSDAKSDANRLVVTLDAPEERNPELVRELVGMGAEIQFVGELRQSLEDIYFQLLGQQNGREDQDG